MQNQTWLLFNKQYIDVLNFPSERCTGGLIYLKEEKATDHDDETGWQQVNSNRGLSPILFCERHCR